LHLRDGAYFANTSTAGWITAAPSAGSAENQSQGLPVLPVRPVTVEFLRTAFQHPLASRSVWIWMPVRTFWILTCGTRFPARRVCTGLLISCRARAAA